MHEVSSMWVNIASVKNIGTPGEEHTHSLHQSADCSPSSQPVKRRRDPLTQEWWRVGPPAERMRFALPESAFGPSLSTRSRRRFVRREPTVPSDTGANQALRLWVGLRRRVFDIMR